MGDAVHKAVEEARDAAFAFEDALRLLPREREAQPLRQEADLARPAGSRLPQHRQPLVGDEGSIESAYRLRTGGWARYENHFPQRLGIVCPDCGEDTPGYDEGEAFELPCPVSGRMTVARRARPLWCDAPPARST